MTTSLALSSLEQNISLAPRTTLGVGGNARWYLRATEESQVLDAFAFANAEMLPVFVLGGGSNLVAADTGFPGLVLEMALAGVQIQAQSDGSMRVAAAAGEDWHAFVRRCVEANLQGIECLAGIPGRVGGTPVQNVGAYGQEVADTIVSVRALDRESGQVHTLSASECGFGYRRSRFNQAEPGRWCILEVTFRLVPAGSPTLGYADLQRYFADAGTPSLTGVADAVWKIRAQKGMVLEEGNPDCRSAGSFFKNPVVAAEEYQRLTEEFPETLPHWPQPDGRVKLSAAWLIERSGFQRGEMLGRAGLSTRHILALTNRGSATASEVVALACRVQDGVRRRWGIEIVPEPVFLGFPSGFPLPAGATRCP